MDEEVRRTYAKVMNMRRHLGNVEMEAAVSELMIAVAETTAAELNAIAVGRRQEEIASIIHLRDSLRQLQHSLETPQTDLRTS